MPAARKVTPACTRPFSKNTKNRKPPVFRLGRLPKRGRDAGPHRRSAPSPRADRRRVGGVASRRGSLPAFDDLEMNRVGAGKSARRFAEPVGVPRTTWCSWRRGAIEGRPVKRWRAPVADAIAQAMSELKGTKHGSAWGHRKIDGMLRNREWQTDFPEFGTAGAGKGELSGEIDRLVIVSDNGPACKADLVPDSSRRTAGWPTPAHAIDLSRQAASSSGSTSRSPTTTSASSRRSPCTSGTRPGPGRAQRRPPAIAPTPGPSTPRSSPRSRCAFGAVVPAICPADATRENLGGENARGAQR